ncbi:MAG: DsbC family protein [Gammaproteobacteria bacterium]|nr:MAG: DsbC family protein [Gammaproteobacteria bacterium]
MRIPSHRPPATGRSGATPGFVQYRRGGFARRLLLAVLLAGLAVPVPADEQAIRAQLARLLPGRQPDAIRRTPIPGLFEVDYGPRIFYVSADGRYLLQGELMDLQTMRNLTGERKSGLVRKAMAALPDDRTIVFPARHEKFRVTVFTDIDCGYCRKLHSQIQGYNALGITIRYAFFPRAGRGSRSWRKAVAVWCSPDRRKALTEAKQGKPVDLDRRCDNPVEEHMQLVEALGLRGTPDIVLEDGDILPGYVPPAQLLRVLERHADPAARSPLRKR